MKKHTAGENIAVGMTLFMFVVMFLGMHNTQAVTVVMFYGLGWFGLEFVKYQFD